MHSFGVRLLRNNCTFFSTHCQLHIPNRHRTMAKESAASASAASASAAAKESARFVLTSPCDVQNKDEKRPVQREISFATDRLGLAVQAFPILVPTFQTVHGVTVSGGVILSSQKIGCHAGSTVSFVFPKHIAAFSCNISHPKSNDALEKEVTVTVYSPGSAMGEMFSLSHTSITIKSVTHMIHRVEIRTLEPASITSLLMGEVAKGSNIHQRMVANESADLQELSKIQPKVVQSSSTKETACAPLVTMASLVAHPETHSLWNCTYCSTNNAWSHPKCGICHQPRRAGVWKIVSDA